MDPELVIDEEMEPDPELNRITNAILGAAFEVHTELGPGYGESIYENALASEFRRRGIRFVRQAVFPVLYKGEVVGEGRIDFLVEDEVVLELKAVESLTSLFMSQVVSYLKATSRRLALLLNNFNVRRLKDGIRRIAR
jgi:GxxExxY protein